MFFQIRTKIPVRINILFQLTACWLTKIRFRAWLAAIIIQREQLKVCQVRRSNQLKTKRNKQKS